MDGAVGIILFIIVLAVILFGFWLWKGQEACATPTIYDLRAENGILKWKFYSNKPYETFNIKSYRNDADFAKGNYVSSIDVREASLLGMNGQGRERTALRTIVAGTHIASISSTSCPSQNSVINY